MEEKILDILRKKVLIDYQRANPNCTTTSLGPITSVSIDMRIAAKEITSHVFKFIEWLIIEEEIFMGELTERYITNRNLKQDITLPELYDYWLKNVKK